MSALWEGGGPSSWGIKIGHLRRQLLAFLGKPSGNTLPCLLTHQNLPWLGCFQVPCPSLPPGLSAVHKSHQAKQEQSESHKIRHSAHVYDATGSCAGAFNGEDAPWLNHGSCLQPPVRASLRGCTGMVGKAEFPNLLTATDACLARSPHTPDHDTRLCPPFCLEIGH